MSREQLLRNPARLMKPPKVDSAEKPILDVDQVKAVLAALIGSEVYPHVVVLLSAGIRRGELMGVQWGDVDLDAGRLRIDRSIEATKKGLRTKASKTAHGRRLIALPPIAIEILRQARKLQLETRLKDTPDNN